MRKKKQLVCAHCGRPSTGEYSIDVDLPGVGECDVWICNGCGAPMSPSIEDMQDKLQSLDPLIVAIKIKRGELCVYNVKKEKPPTKKLTSLPF